MLNDNESGSYREDENTITDKTVGNIADVEDNVNVEDNANVEEIWNELKNIGYANYSVSNLGRSEMINQIEY